MPTYAGFNQNFELSKYPQKIQMALRKVAQTFYVTRSFDGIQVDNSTYFAALIRPTDDSSVVLNTQRELLILFADYDTFEVRTLEAYNKFLDLVASARIDRGIRFLVSDDHDIERAIKLYLEKHLEYPIIVPLTFEALNTRINPLISAVRQNYHIRDLFGFQAALKEEHFFFGRSDIVSSVVDLAKSGQHSSLFGLRKSGKTSTIHAIQRRSKPTELIIVTFDCESLSVHCRRYGDLLVHIVETIRSQNRLKALQRPQSLEGVVVSEWFNLYMTQTMSALQTNLLIIFDEIEKISPHTGASDHWRSGNDPLYFWQVLRSFAQATKKFSLSVCIVGTSPYLLEQARINGVDNPAYLLAQKRFIPNLTFDETREMVDRLGFFMGLDFDAAAISRLHSAYGGHPFFTRQVCSKVHQLTFGRRPKDVPLQRVDQAQAAFAGQLESYLHEIVYNIKVYYDEEFALLRQLIIGRPDELAEYVNRAPDLIDHLLGYGLITVRDGVPEIAFESVRRAVLRIAPDEKNVDLEDKWGELCLRRGKIEQGIRTTLSVWARGVDASEFVSIISSQLSKRRFEALDRLDYRFLFSNIETPLYLTDLVAILGSEKVLPYLGSRRSELRAALNEVNKYRADAHAKDILDQEMVNAKIAFDAVEDEFLI